MIIIGLWILFILWMAYEIKHPYEEPDNSEMSSHVRYNQDDDDELGFPLL